MSYWDCGPNDHSFYTYRYYIRTPRGEVFLPWHVSMAIEQECGPFWIHDLRTNGSKAHRLFKSWLSSLEVEDAVDAAEEYGGGEVARA